MTGLVLRDQVIEVGAGTGQLTMTLLRMGLQLLLLSPVLRCERSSPDGQALLAG